MGRYRLNIEVHTQHSRKGCKLGWSPDTRYCARNEAATQVTAVHPRKAAPRSLLCILACGCGWHLVLATKT